MYLYMGYTVSRITKSLQQYALLDIKDLKHEPCRFWLEDKVANGNIFQRHFNLICMLRDIYVCSLLLALYKNPTLMLVFLLIQQSLMLTLALCYPPYRVKWNNTVMQVTQGLYLILDVAFLVNINAKLTPTARYNYVGFWMIATVLGIIFTNIGVAGYHNTSESIKKCRKKKVAAQGKVYPIKEPENSSGDNSKVGLDNSHSKGLMGAEQTKPDVSALVPTSSKPTPKQSKPPSIIGVTLKRLDPPSKPGKRVRSKFRHTPAVPS
jgi:hypothetical protein